MHRRSLALIISAALLAGCAAHSSAPFVPQGNGAVRGVASIGRGSIILLRRVGIITKKQMEGGVAGPVVSQIGGKPACNVLLYAVDYNTVGVAGEAANASAAFMIPQKGCGAGPYPLVGYAHGTNIVKEQKITDPKSTSPTGTAPDQDPVVVAAIYAAHGYVVAATDYLGLGDSTYPYHPYLHVDSEATAVIDAMRAVRLAAKQLGVPLRKGTGVLLAGHSQGGQVTMGTQRAIESQYRGEFSVTAMDASSGPYALSLTFQDSLKKQSQDAPILAAYILPGYNKAYGQNIYGSTPSTIFKSPYATTVDTLLPVATFADQTNLEKGKGLPLKLNQLLQPAFKANFLTNPKYPARIDAADNDLLKGWKAKAQVNVCGGSHDPEVEFKNAELAQNYFIKVKSQVTLTDVNALIPKSVPIGYYHVTVALFCLTIGRVQFFDTLPKT